MTPFNCLFLDVPRVVLGNPGLPLTNQSDAKNEERGTYLIPSLHFLTDTIVEAWEVHAEQPGLIQLQVSLPGVPSNQLLFSLRDITS